MSYCKLSLYLAFFIPNVLIAQTPLGEHRIIDDINNIEQLSHHNLNAAGLHYLESHPEHLFAFDQVPDLTSQAWLDYHLLENSVHDVIAYTESKSPEAISSDLKLLSANTAYFDQDYALAAEKYKLYQSNYELDPAGQFRLGYSFFNLSEFKSALSQFENLRTHSELGTHATYFAGMSQFFIGNIDESLIALEEVIDIPPYDKYTPYYTTQLYFSKGDYEKSLNQGLQYKENGQHKTEMTYIIGQSHYMLGNKTEALTELTAYERGTEKLSAQDFYQLALLHYETGNLKKSKSYLKEILHGTDRFSTAGKYLMANIYLQQENLDAALRLFKSLSETESKYQESSIVNTAYLAYKTGDNNLTLKYAEKMLKINGKTTQATALQKAVLLSGEDLEGSIKYLENQNPIPDDLQETYITLLESKIENLALAKDYTFMPTYLDKLKSADGSNPNIHYWQMLYDYQLGNYQQITLDAKPIATVATDNQPTYASIVGSAFYNNQDYENAIPYLQFAMNTSSPQPHSTYALMLADIHAYQGKESEAKEYYLGASKNGNDYAIYRLSQIAKSENEPYDQIYLLETLIENYPQTEYRLEALFELGESHLQLSKVNQAIGYYKACIDEADKDEQILHDSNLRLGLCYYQSGKYQEAMGYYKNVVESDATGEQKRVALQAIKDIYINHQSNTDDYFQYVDDNTDIELKDIEKDSISFALANGYFVDAKYEQAVTAFEKYLTTFPQGLSVHEARFNLAESYAGIEDYDSSIEPYTLSAESGVSPYSQMSIKRLSIIHLNHTQNYTEALRYFKQGIALETNPEDKKNAIDGAVFAAVKTSDPEISSLASLIIDDPSRSKDERAKAYYYRGRQHKINGSDDTAIKDLTEVTRLSNANIAAEANYLIAETFYLKGDLERAETQAMETTKRSREYPFWIAKSLLLLGDVFIDKEDLYNAQAAVETVIEEYPDNAEILSEAQEKQELIQSIIDKRSRILEDTEETLFFNENAEDNDNN